MNKQHPPSQERIQNKADELEGQALYPTFERRLKRFAVSTETKEAIRAIEIKPQAI